MWPFKKKVKKKHNHKYYAMLVQKAVPLSRKWYAIMQASNNPKKVDRILRHLYRIAAIQSAADAKARGK